MENTSTRIAPCLWFDGQAEQAVDFYCSIFPNSRVGRVSRYDETSAQAAGQPAGGDASAQQCGWLKDRYGVSWQVVPTVLAERMSDPDPERARRATQAMLAMKKFDIAALLRAAG